MTSDDRHASHDSHYRTGQHVPLNSNRHAPLTSVATNGMESRPDLNSPYHGSLSRSSTFGLQNGLNGFPGSPSGLQSPSSPYSPGLRSSSALQKDQSNENTNPFDNVNAGDIQMQSFQEGLPPPPPVSHSWKRIDRWAEDNYEELFDQLAEGCTQNDVNELEHELDCSLPMEVRDSLRVHDGQERGGMPTGIIFGCMLLDCEEIVQEWRNWRTVNEEYLTEAGAYREPQTPIKAFGGASSSSTSQSQQSANPLWRQELSFRQDSQPPNAIQKVYAHHLWIPLARDWGGNNIAVDLAPGPTGKWGQVILFGRDYDCKYVIARSWSAFLATVADDMSSEKVFVDEETQELKLKEFKTANVEPSYMDILRWRTDQKYGRRGPRRKSGGNRQVSGDSPYSSPTSERGRSPQRFPSPGPGSSTPRGNYGKSPLARVNEEGLPMMPKPIRTNTGILANKDPAAPLSATSERGKKLVEVETPKASDEKRFFKGPEPETTQLNDSKRKDPLQGLGVKGIDGISEKTALGNAGEMKIVQI
ncbi:MAG: Cell wall assembly regulator [Candelina mexicana]|nr:MAG: Cell wall assembly regulator [Candelina mexicana]